MRSLWVLICCGLVLLGGACSLDRTPELLTVTGIAPDRGELGDRIEVSGAGFAQGRRASVHFLGRVHRPGAPDTRVDLLVHGHSSSPTAVEFVVTQELERAFCDVPDGPPQHGTFRGEVTLAFTPKEDGAPPVRGVLTDVVFDVFPSSRSQEISAGLNQSGMEVLGYLGVAQMEATRDGLRVAAMTPDSRLGATGARVGDTITTFNSVRVFSAADVQAAPGRRHAVVDLTRAAGVTATTQVDLDGLRPSVPEPMSLAGSVLAFIGATLLLWFLWGRRLFTWAQWRHAVTEERRHALPAETPSQDRSSRWSQFILLGVACFLLLQSGRNRSWVSPTVDVLLGFALLSLLLALGVFVGGGRVRRGWSLRRAFLSLVAYVPMFVAGAGALCCLLLTAGHVDPGAWVRTQGAAPWQWAMFQSPLLLLAALLWTFAALPRPTLALGTLESSLEGTSRPELPVLQVLGAAHVALVAAFAAAAFLGGWRLPFSDSAQLTAMGAVMFGAKAVLVQLGVERVRTWTSLDAPEHYVHVVLRWGLPTLILTLGLEPLWSLVGAHPLAIWTTTAVRELAFLLGVTLLIAVVWMRRRRPLSARAQAVNPWL